MSKSQKKTHKLARAPQQVKVIAGRWRGTTLPVVLRDDVRPTPSRVRETLFNWLQARIEGSHCLDLFTGSGALGFEAVSRGAAHATLVDNDQKIVSLLSQQVEKLDAQEISLTCANALAYLQNCSAQFDIIFLDPPFAKYNPEELLQMIIGSECVKKGGLIYLEASPEKFPQTLPDKWQWKRQLKAGQVECGLIVAK
ncbi:MAG: 16S rRNA (guanine(966)-N(2))-methyltransferase RsmD [Gammaproteobacteria bacterium]|nr:16S rRNA (guanine(966)-N(2))-methyltransferase RsmD [Gammaproteobacteria bacterium]